MKYPYYRRSLKCYFKDLTSAVRKVIHFLGKHYTEEQIIKLVQYLSFDNFKKNPAVNLNHLDEIGLLNHGEEPFIRKGNFELYEYKD